MFWLSPPNFYHFGLDIPYCLEPVFCFPEFDLNDLVLVYLLNEKGGKLELTKEDLEKIKAYKLDSKYDGKKLTVELKK